MLLKLWEGTTNYKDLQMNRELSLQAETWWTSKCPYKHRTKGYSGSNLMPYITNKFSCVFCLRTRISCHQETCTIMKGTTNTSLRAAGNFSSCAIHKHTLNQTNNASNRYNIYIYIYIHTHTHTHTPIARAKLHLQLCIIRFWVNSIHVLVRKFQMQGA
jgi:hypothetical protein